MDTYTLLHPPTTTHARAHLPPVTTENGWRGEDGGKMGRAGAGLNAHANVVTASNITVT